MNVNELPTPYKNIGNVQIGDNKLKVMYYFNEQDSIYCKIIDTIGANSFPIGEEFITHYKSLIV